MRFLIVEDNPADTELLRNLLEMRFAKANYIDANSLDEAIRMLERLDIDVVLLDLNLPDSVGDATFTKLYSRFPHVPIIVMTHNKDRQLAVRMVREGAADYLLKDFRVTDENIEQVYTRIRFAIERHRRSVRLPEEETRLSRKVEKAQANMLSAHQSGRHTIVQSTAVEATSAMADLTRKLVIEVQKLAQEVTQGRMHDAQVAEQVENLERELIRGHSGRPSMRSQVDVLEHRVNYVESGMKGLEVKLESAENTQRQQVIKFSETRLTNRTKVLLGLLGFLGVLATASATYYAATANKAPQPNTPQEPRHGANPRPAN